MKAFYGEKEITEIRRFFKIGQMRLADVRFADGSRDRCVPVALVVFG
ncbi:MAG: hypothetical protein HPY85_06700 [Anaerolineae bacterium]|nr:hypothetical protein [Anaerolineae bacterium]